MLDVVDIRTNQNELRMSKAGPQYVAEPDAGLDFSLV
jgi:hypothetical protein